MYGKYIAFIKEKWSLTMFFCYIYSLALFLFSSLKTLEKILFPSLSLLSGVVPDTELVYNS